MCVFVYLRFAVFACLFVEPKTPERRRRRVYRESHQYFIDLLRDFGLHSDCGVYVCVEYNLKYLFRNKNPNNNKNIKPILIPDIESILLSMTVERRPNRYNSPHPACSSHPQITRSHKSPLHFVQFALNHQAKTNGSRFAR